MQCAAVRKTVGATSVPLHTSWSVVGCDGSSNAIIAPTFGCAFPSCWPFVIATAEPAVTSAAATAPAKISLFDNGDPFLS